MREGRASFTASWVAGARGLSGLLPPEARLVHDPYGIAFGGTWARIAERFGTRLPGVSRLTPRLGPLTHSLLWMQIRTRAIDDAVRAFVQRGGRQIVLLGAGFDCRSLRLRSELRDASVFEVDHPATQARKRDVLRELGETDPHARYLPWDFEGTAMSDLPRALAGAGLHIARATLTVWEGVTMYLTEPAIEQSLRAVATYSGPRSELVLTYFDRRRLTQPSLSARIVARAVSRAGEPFRWGWVHDEFPVWMNAHGYEVLANDRDVTLARSYRVPEALVRAMGPHGGHVGVVVPMHAIRGEDWRRG